VSIKDFDGVLANKSSMLKGYRRSTRYERMDAKLPRFLAMHEFDTPAVPPEMKLVLGTEWSKKIIGGAQAANNDIWSYISETGKGAKGEPF